MIYTLKTLSIPLNSYQENLVYPNIFTFSFRFLALLTVDSLNFQINQLTLHQTHSSSQHLHLEGWYIPIHKFINFCLVSLTSIKELWESDLGEEISEERWEKALDRVQKSSICVKHGLIQCKIIHRAHFTKVRLSKIYPDVDPTCGRCCQASASHVHRFWSCPALFLYWSEIIRSLSKIIQKSREPNAMIALFGISPPTISLSSSEAALVAFVTLLMRRLILLKWRSPTPPSHTVDKGSPPFY